MSVARSWAPCPEEVVRSGFYSAKLREPRCELLTQPRKKLLQEPDELIDIFACRIRIVVGHRVANPVRTLQVDLGRGVDDLMLGERLVMARRRLLEQRPWHQPIEHGAAHKYAVDVVDDR